MIQIRTGLLCLAIIAYFTPASAAGADDFPFPAGSARLSLFFGNAVAFNRNYSVLGIGGGYFVADGFEVGLEAESWSGNSPHVEQITPQARFVLNTATGAKPYIGAFYRRTYIEGYRDLDTVGARGGVYFLSGRNAFFGAGLVQDIHVNCDRTVYSSCAETYPELIVALLFR